VTQNKLTEKSDKGSPDLSYTPQKSSSSSSHNKNHQTHHGQHHRGTVVGKQRSEVLPPHKTKLIDIQAPDLSLGKDDNYSRSITLTASQGVASARIDPGPAASVPSFKNNDRSAVVRAVVSVADSEGNLVRRGTVTDITHEQ